MTTRRKRTRRTGTVVPLLSDRPGFRALRVDHIDPHHDPDNIAHCRRVAGDLLATVNDLERLEISRAEFVAFVSRMHSPATDREIHEFALMLMRTGGLCRRRPANPPEACS